MRAVRIVEIRMKKGTLQTKKNLSNRTYSKSLEVANRSFYRIKNREKIARIFRRMISATPSVFPKG